MRKDTTCLFLLAGLLSVPGVAQNKKDSTQFRRNYVIDEVVVTGTRNETDVRHLPMTISVVGRQQIEKRYEPSLLPLLTEQVPGLFTTSRGIMGYGRLHRSGGRHEPAGCRWQSYGRIVSFNRRSPAVYGTDGASDSRCLPIHDDGKGRGFARPCIRALRFKCYGRSYQYRHPQARGRGDKYQYASRIWFI